MARTPASVMNIALRFADRGEGVERLDKVEGRRSSIWQTIV